MSSLRVTAAEARVPARVQVLNCVLHEEQLRFQVSNTLCPAPAAKSGWDVRTPPANNYSLVLASLFRMRCLRCSGATQAKSEGLEAAERCSMPLPASIPPHLRPQHRSERNLANSRKHRALFLYALALVSRLATSVSSTRCRAPATRCRTAGCCAAATLRCRMLGLRGHVRGRRQAQA